MAAVAPAVPLAAAPAAAAVPTRWEINGTPVLPLDQQQRQAAKQEERHVSSRVLVVFSLYFVFSLAVWSFTSRVYRAPLPSSPDLTQAANQVEADSSVSVTIALALLMADAQSPSTAAISQLTQHYQQAVAGLQTAAALKLSLAPQPLIIVDASAHALAVSAASGSSASHQLREADDAIATSLAAKLPKDQGAVDITFVLVITSAATAAAPWTIGQHNHAWTYISSTEDVRPVAMFSNVLSDMLLLSSSKSTSPLPDADDSSAPSTRESLLCVSDAHAHYRLSLSLLNADPGSWQDSVSREGIAWQIEQALQKYWTPIRTALSQFATVDIDTQILNYTPITHDKNAFKYEASNTTADTGSDARQPDSSRGTYILTAASLRNRFMGATSWNVESPFAVASNALEASAEQPQEDAVQTIEFMCYLPARSHFPLVIRSKKSVTLGQTSISSWMVPRWGGVVVYNADVLARANASPKPNTTITPSATPNVYVLSPEELRPVLSTWLSQLRVMFGLRPLHSTDSSSKDGVVAESKYRIVSPASGIAEWETSSLLRLRILSYIRHTAATLRAVHTMLTDAGHAHMPLSDASAARLREGALDQLQRASKLMAGAEAASGGRTKTLINAARTAGKALSAAQAAFFDPTMIGLLYFPDEHLYAVYAPFFVPVLVPVVTALAARFKRWRKQRAAAAAVANR